MNMPLILAARHLPTTLALKEMVNANHDYRGEW